MLVSIYLPDEESGSLAATCYQLGADADLYNGSNSSSSMTVQPTVRTHISILSERGTVVSR